MSRELGSAVEPCPLKKASLTVEVARQDGHPLSEPIQVRLTKGKNKWQGTARGSPARTVFAGLEEGTYSIEIGEPGGDESGFVTTSNRHEQVEVAHGVDRTAVVPLDVEHGDLLGASIVHDTEPLPTDDLHESAEEEDEESEVESVTIHSEPDEAD